MTDVLPPDDDAEVVIIRKKPKPQPEVKQDPGSTVADPVQDPDVPGVDDSNVWASTPVSDVSDVVDVAEPARGLGQDAAQHAPDGAGDAPMGADAPGAPKAVKVISIARDEDLEGPMPVLVGEDDALTDGTSRPADPVAVDPRLSDRRREVDRLLTRRRILVGSGIVAVLLLIVGTLAVFASSIFDVQTITVYGNVYTADEQLVPILAELRGQPILTVDINKARAQIESLPFVKQADIATDFPHTVHIEIEERQPALGYIGQDGQWRVIDDDGRVLTFVGGQPKDYKPINGVGPDVNPGQFAPPGYAAAATIARSMPNELEPYMASFTVKQSGDIDLVLSTGTVISFGQPTDMTAKLAAVLSQFRKLAPSKVAAIDVTNPAAIGVTPK